GHAKDLPLPQLLELVNHSHKDVRELAVALLAERDPRKEIGLAAWASLLGSPYGGELAETAIVKHFSARELSPEWFAAALLKPAAFAFGEKHLLKVHSLQALGPGFFIGLFHYRAFDRFCASFVMQNLRKFSIEELDVEFLREALFDRLTRASCVEWVETGFCDSKRFGVDFLFALAYHPEWEASEWVQSRIAADKDAGARRYPDSFDPELSARILGWLSDVRKFQPQEIGFERLMRLVERKEPGYHDFAAKYMIKAFVPADFAPAEQADPAQATDPSQEITIDLQGQSFLFTGKLKTMTRSEAEKKVVDAKGKNGSAVNKALDYLVIGDEGSPLYGAGKKGSKQLKGEALSAEGAPIKIISETAFLQMLTGTRKEADADTVAAGSARLWEFAVKPGSERNPIRLFALGYIRHHHQDIGPLLSERPVDPGAEIPHDFFSFERLLPLLQDKRPSLVDFALELARWEAARWRPGFAQLVELSESGAPKVREFFAKALTAGPEKAHDRYRLPADLISADNVYRLCESADDFTRNLGMQLLDLHPELADAASLFRLTESADRRMRYFAVEAIWRSFRERGVSHSWTPPRQTSSETPSQTPAAGPAGQKPAQKKAKAQAQAKTEVVKETVKEGEKQDPKQASPWLADARSMQLFLRRMLFELPPGRAKEKRKRVKTLPSAKAKVALVETYRNMALRDKSFAEMAVPVLSEFMASRGLLEERACLVALARISQKYPDFEFGFNLGKHEAQV
ncbi:MAG: BRCT domain-containing protein, partial [Candidatus Sericytochromatia bacterium]